MRVEGVEWRRRWGRTPVVDRKKERSKGELKQAATLEKAVMMTAMARFP
jgi:hypothetical protein